MEICVWKRKQRKMLKYSKKKKSFDLEREWKHFQSHEILRQHDLHRERFDMWSTSKYHEDEKSILSIRSYRLRNAVKNFPQLNFLLFIFTLVNEEDKHTPHAHPFASRSLVLLERHRRSNLFLIFLERNLILWYTEMRRKGNSLSMPPLRSREMFLICADSRLIWISLLSMRQLLARDSPRISV